jgi:hypothetical protein
MKFSDDKPINFKIRLSQKQYDFLCSQAKACDISVAKYLRTLIDTLYTRYEVALNENEKITIHDIL